MSVKGHKMNLKNDDAISDPETCNDVEMNS